MRICLLVPLLLTALAAPASAFGQQATVPLATYGQQPVPALNTALHVEPGQPVKVTIDLAENAWELGLEEDRVRKIAEVRLKEAMIPVEEDSSRTAPNTLYVNVNVNQDSLFVIMAFAKLVMTKVGDLQYLRRMTTWTDRAAGLHKRSEEIVRAGIRSALDKFVIEFLRANPTAAPK